MNSNMMELNMDELAAVNGGFSLEEKIEIVATCAASGVVLGGVSGGGIGSLVPVVGTAVGAVIGGTVGAAIFGGGAAIRVFLFGD